MSRIGKLPIAIPDKVEVAIDGHNVEVKGPLGTLSRELSQEVSVKIEDNKIIVERPDDTRTATSHQG